MPDPWLSRQIIAAAGPWMIDVAVLILLLPLLYVMVRGSFPARGAGTHITGSGMTQHCERVDGRRL